MYFKKSVEVVENTEVITNLDNQVTINSIVIRKGKRYITFRTVVNYIMSFFNETDIYI